VIRRVLHALGDQVAVFGRELHAASCRAEDLADDLRGRS
jgi:hypothetical protein